MKTKLQSLLIVLAMFACVHQAAAQGTRFFRISGPTITTITAWRMDGTIIWSNAMPGAVYTFQAASYPAGGTNWVDYVQITATNGVVTNRLIDISPPAGMALIPAGVFTMGDTLDGESNAIPTSVTVSGFYMDTQVVSYGFWLSVYNWATNNGYDFDNPGSGKAANHPVQTVDWYDAVKWCNARSEMESLKPAYYTDGALTIVYRSGVVDLASTNVSWDAGYRLPTEAEWEKAARGGLVGQRFPWGNLISESLADYFGKTNVYTYDLGPNGSNQLFNKPSLDFPYTSPVGYFAPNGYGLYDMAGNIMQWCWDWYGPVYAGGIDPRGPESGSNFKILREGSWQNNAHDSRCAARTTSYGYTGEAANTIGFRCARGL